MRTRAHRAKMLHRAVPCWPLYWTVPPHLIDDPAHLRGPLVDEPGAVQEALRRVLQRYRYGLQPGSEVVVEVVQNSCADLRHRDVVLRVEPSPRARQRDVSSARARLLRSNPAERTPK